MTYTEQRHKSPVTLLIRFPLILAYSLVAEEAFQLCFYLYNAYYRLYYRLY